MNPYNGSMNITELLALTGVRQRDILNHICTNRTFLKAEATGNAVCIFCDVSTKSRPTVGGTCSVTPHGLHLIIGNGTHPEDYSGIISPDYFDLFCRITSVKDCDTNKLIWTHTKGWY